MANMRAGMVLVGSLVGTAGVNAVAAPAAELVVVVHVADYQGVPRAELSRAERETARLYAQAGVELRWMGGRAGSVLPDGLLHTQVTILDQQMTERLGPASNTLGHASHKSRVAYIFYRRIVAYAVANESDPALVLAQTLGHELGHIILPEHSHAPSGIMSASWERGRVRRLPRFSPTEAAMIRAMVARGDVQ